MIIQFPHPLGNYILFGTFPPPSPPEFCPCPPKPRSSRTHDPPPPREAEPPPPRISRFAAHEAANHRPPVLLIRARTRSRFRCPCSLVELSPPCNSVNASISICRTRSRVTPIRAPTSFSVIGS